MQYKEEQARTRKKENELKRVEKRIEELENQDHAIDEEMSLPEVCTDVARCTLLSRQKADILAELDELYNENEDVLILAGLDPEKMEYLPAAERKRLLEEAGLDPREFDF